MSGGSDALTARAYAEADRRLAQINDLDEATKKLLRAIVASAFVDGRLEGLKEMAVICGATDAG